jgi:hypothetical protein
MHRAISFDQRRCIGPYQLAIRIFDRVGGQGGVEPLERVTQPSFEYDVAEVRVGALNRGLAHGNVGAVENGVAKAFQPSECGILDDRLRESRHRGNNVVAEVRFWESMFSLNEPKYLSRCKAEHCRLDGSEGQPAPKWIKMSNRPTPTVCPVRESVRPGNEMVTHPPCGNAIFRTLAARSPAHGAFS